MISRRCCICANLNPCRDHTEDAQEEELRRNTREFYRIVYQREREEREKAPSPAKGENADG